MRIAEVMVRYIKNPLKVIRVLGTKGLLNWVPDGIYLRLLYVGELGKKLHLDSPLEFNEKLQWIKLNDRKREYSMYVDKYLVRTYVERVIGSQYLIPLIGVYNNVQEINWNTLPDQFVLKCTHGSHCNIICTDKDNLDIKDANSKLTKWMKSSWYWFGREWPYQNVRGRIVCEQYLGDLAGVPNDYKIMCFNGKPQIIQIHKKDNNGQHTIDFYDMNGDLLPFRKIGFENSDVHNIDVESLEEMFELARILSTGTLYLRTDFYLVNRKIYFGELTFFDSSGLIDFEPRESNTFLGDIISLDVERIQC